MNRNNGFKEIFMSRILLFVVFSQALLLCLMAETARADVKTHTFPGDYRGHVYVVVRISLAERGSAPTAVPDFQTVSGKILWGPWEGTFKKLVRGHGQKEIAVRFEKKNKDRVPLTVETAPHCQILGFYTGIPDKGKYIVTRASWRKR